MAWVAGVDGCRSGWAVALLSAAGEVRFERCHGVRDVLALPEAPVRVALDMPIGLPDRPVVGGRRCDREARQRLQPHRASSVFSPPLRRWLEADIWSSAMGMSRQTFHLLPKIREVDAWITPALQDTVTEAHPELAFAAMAGGPLAAGKRTAAGREARLSLLPAALAVPMDRLAAAVTAARSRWSRREAGDDDWLDALALAWSARRWADGCAEQVPGEPIVDGRGLAMQIRW